MGSIAAEEAGMEAEMECGGAGGKRLAEDCDLLTDAFRERAFGRVEAEGSGKRPAEGSEARGGKRARDDADTDAAQTAEAETEFGFFRRLLRQCGCEVPGGGETGADGGADGGARKPCAPEGCSFTSASASAASVRKVRPIPVCRTLPSAGRGQAAVTNGNGVTDLTARRTSTWRARCSSMARRAAGSLPAWTSTWTTRSA
jgi:hypothetical protein